MELTARNKIPGRIASMESGKAMTIITVQGDGVRLVSAVTNEGTDELKLEQNEGVTAVINATNVMLVKGQLGQAAMSARNRITGQVEMIQKGDAMGYVSLRTGGVRLGAAVTRRALEEMGLSEGDTVTAIIKATDVMLMRPTTESDSARRS
jgi:molybdate transport system regulatory protein